MTYDSIDHLLSRMRADLAELTAAGDARRFFHATYLRTTQAVADEIARGGFADEHWVREWDLAFASLYLDALDAGRCGDASAGSVGSDPESGPVSGPWRVAFDVARRRPELPPLRHVLFGLNAHINYDLPQALLAVISVADFDNEELLHRREADHNHVDAVLQARVGTEDAELGAVSRVTLVDRLLRPANQAASRRFLAEARGKVWRNATVLDRARRQGPERYRDVLAELERLCAQRVLDLTAPGPVLLTLARRGFGVLLPGA
jgi:Family of unknown function (DUF5995)